MYAQYICDGREFQGYTCDTCADKWRKIEEDYEDVREMPRASDEDNS